MKPEVRESLRIASNDTLSGSIFRTYANYADLNLRSVTAPLRITETGFPGHIESLTMTEILTFRFVSPDGEEHTLMHISSDAFKSWLIEADPAASREEDRRRRGHIIVNAKPDQIQEINRDAVDEMRRPHLNKAMKWRIEGDEGRTNIEGMFKVTGEKRSKRSGGLWLRLTPEER